MMTVSVELFGVDDWDFEAHLGSDKQPFQALSNAAWDPLSAGSSTNEKTRRFQRVYLMELGGFEPPTSWVRSRRSPS